MMVDSDAAIANALASRVDLARARCGRGERRSAFQRQQRLSTRLNASYQANGLGGTEVLRTGGFPGVIVGPGRATPFGNILDQLARADYPMWAAGVSISSRSGRAQDAALRQPGRARAGSAPQSAQACAIQQVREAAWKVEMNAKRVDTTRALATLAEQRLDAERKRFDVGMSTSFLVIQAQRDFVDARTDALAAILAYDLALVDLEAVQQAGPAGATQAGNSAASPASSLEASTGRIRPAAASPWAFRGSDRRSALAAGGGSGRNGPRIADGIPSTCRRDSGRPGAQRVGRGDAPSWAHGEAQAETHSRNKPRDTRRRPVGSTMRQARDAGASTRRRSCETPSPRVTTSAPHWPSRSASLKPVFCRSSSSS
jgi:hypothetical protein